MIGTILAIVGGIACLALWIMTLVKQFKGGDTVWGVLTIFFSPLVPIIWGFMKGQQKLAIYWIIAAVILAAGYGMSFASLLSKAQDMQIQ